MEVDGGRAVVAGGGGFVAFFDAVAVVAGAFDRAGAAAVAAGGVGGAGDSAALASVSGRSISNPSMAINRQFRSHAPRVNRAATG
jgi:hypothetical protein